MINISILQEYEKIKEIIGEDRWSNIDQYIKINTELSYDELIYDMFNWIKFDRWYNDKIKNQKVEVLGIWETDYDDIACNAILYKNDSPVANIIESFDESTIRYVYGDTNSELNEELIKASFESLINDNFEKYLKLPKISKCSNLLQQIYDRVCESDASMCHVDDIDWLYWKENYDFNDSDIELLKQEISQYKLNEIIGINDCGYKIVGYSDLQIAFNDDRKLQKGNDIEI